MKTLARIFVPIMACALLLAARGVEAAVVGDVELLQRLAVQHRANTESIVTWTGEASISYAGRRGDNYVREMQNNMSFAFGRTQDAVRWNRQTKRSLFRIDGKERQDPDAGYSAGMLKGGRFYRYAVPEDVKNQQWQYLHIQQPNDYARQMNTLDFDPRDFLKDHGEPLYDRLMFLYRNASSPGLVDWRVSQSGSLVTVEARFDSGNSVNRYVFDVARGANLVSYYSRVTGEEKREYDYENKGGIWVLKAAKWSHVYKQDNVNVSDTQEVEFSKNVVNEPLAPDEFALVKLGVRPGDWVIDTLSQVRFKYMEDIMKGSELPGELESAEPLGGLDSTGMSPTARTSLPQPQGPEPPGRRPGGPANASPGAGDATLASPSGGWRYYAYGAMSVSLLLIIGFIIARRMRRPRKEGDPQ